MNLNLKIGFTIAIDASRHNRDDGIRVVLHLKFARLVMEFVRANEFEFLISMPLFGVDCEQIDFVFSRNEIGNYIAGHTLFTVGGPVEVEGVGI